MLKYVIIGMVLDEPLTGYEIKKYIENGIGVFYKASYGSLYPTLKKLSEKEQLTMCEKAQGHRQKKYYQATEQGKTAFFEWLSAPMNFNDGVDDHLVKIYFFDKLPAEIRDRQLQEYEVRNTNYLRKLQTLEKHFNEMENKECFYFKLSTLYYGISIVQDNIKWCKHLREQKPLTGLLEGKL